MCRLVGAVGRYSTLRGYYGELIRGLVGASEYDPHAVRAFGPRSSSHRDGWGRFSLLVGVGRVASSTYKSLSPIFVDRPQDALPRADLAGFSDPLVLDFVHARAASAGMPVNYLSVQPFEVQARDGSRLVLIHNGSVDKERLASELGSRVPEEALGRYSDSYVLALKLAEMVDGDVGPDALRQLKGYVRTALNLGVLLISEDRAVKVFGSYYRDDTPPERRDYYRMYVASVGRDCLLYASSTVVDFAEYRPRSVEGWREIENGAYFFVRVDLSRTKDVEVSVEKHLV